MSISDQKEEVETEDDLENDRITMFDDGADLDFDELRKERARLIIEVKSFCFVI